MIPSLSLIRNIDPESARKCGPLVYSAMRRAKAQKPLARRHITALYDYMEKCGCMDSGDPVQYKALGGRMMHDWAKSALDNMPDTGTVIGQNDILVLGLPYGGPNAGKDNDGQFFSAQTDFMDELIETPPVLYTHGTQNGFAPEPVGKIKKRWYDKRGGWFKVELDPESPRYDQLMEANAYGTLRASTGVVPASFDLDKSTGHINTWLVGELSLVDMRDGFQPVNGYAITKAESIVFEDYYGDPVLEAPSMTTIEAIKHHLNQLFVLLGRETPADNPEMVSDATFNYKAEDVPQPKAEEITLDPVEQKCEACDEAERLAAVVKAEIEADGAKPKCSLCPQAVEQVRTFFKAGKIRPTEAFEALERFTKSDAGYEAWKSDIESREAIPATAETVLKAQPLFIAGGTHRGNPDDINAPVDNDHMNKQRRLAGLPVK